MTIPTNHTNQQPCLVKDYELVLSTSIEPGKLFVGIPSYLADFDWNHCAIDLGASHLDIVSLSSKESVRLENLDQSFIEHPLPKIFAIVDIANEKLFPLPARSLGASV